MRWLNTWLESPAIDARLLPWWAAGAGATGWLFWGVNFWSGERKAVGLPVPAANTAVLGPVGGSSLRSRFSAAMYNPVANPHVRDAFSNGDGILVFPGKRGPLASVRLENFRDGLEDAALLRRLSADRRVAIVGAVMTSRTGTMGGPSLLGVNVTAGPKALEALRRRAASAVEDR